MHTHTHVQVYIYFTRIVVLLVESMLPYTALWVAAGLNQVATLAYFIYTGAWGVPLRGGGEQGMCWRAGSRVREGDTMTSQTKHSVGFLYGLYSISPPFPPPLPLCACCERHAGYQFQPVEANPYFRVNASDEDGMDVDIDLDSVEVSVSGSV